ncbi:hypothetical protein Q666_05135 [Marinobacter sp. ES-1]|nr:hypothetical protein Q666_05135 [Marinobacter sp. ES-1]
MPFQSRISIKTHTLSKNQKPRMHKKPHLPEKTCPVCQRPFTWRKKWAKDWDNVRYCSERCRRARSTQP